ncbi:MAG: O-antigen ligase family protein [Patescibacteria group bacterium]|jgi:hypothetical protein
MNLRRSVQLIFATLVFLAPFGTRYIWSRGAIAGFPVEAGTISLFATQILAVVFVFAAFALAARERRLGRLAGPAAAAAAALPLAALLASVISGPVSGWNLLAVSWIALGALVLCGIRLVEAPFLTVAAAFVASAAVQAALAAAQFFTQSAVSAKWFGMAPHEAAVAGSYVVETASGRWLRAYGSLAHPNILGFFLAVGIFFAVGLLLTLPAGSRARRLAAASLPLLAAGIFCSLSRSAVLALAAGFVVLLIWSVRFSKPSFSAVFRSALAVTAVLLLFGSIFNAVVFTRLSGSGRLEARSFNDRRSQLQDAAEIIADHPLMGVGLGEMPLALERDHGDGRPGWGYEPVHNVYLLSLAEIGLLGLIAWLSTLALALHSSMTAAARGSAPAAVIAAGLAAVIVASCFDHYLWSSWFGQLQFWLLCGLAWSFGRNDPAPLDV